MTLTVATPAFIKAFEDITKNLPKSAEEVAKQWASAISLFSKNATVLASIFPIIDPIKIIELENLFLTSLNSMRFIEDFGKNLTQWWLSVFWAGLTFTGTTVIKSNLELGNFLLLIPPDKFGQILAAKISDWMVSNINVLVVNNATAPPTTIGTLLIE